MHIIGCKSVNLASRYNN